MLEDFVVQRFRIWVFVAEVGVYVAINERLEMNAFVTFGADPPLGARQPCLKKQQIGGGTKIF